MSIAQNEIAGQITLIKREWKETVESLNAIASGAQAPPGMSRADFKEWKHLHQQKGKFHLAELEERLKRLQMLESRLKAVRGLATEHNSELMGTMPPAAASDAGSQHFSEDIDGQDRNAHFPETMLLPGTAYDHSDFAGSAHDIRRPATVVVKKHSERLLYQRPSTIMGSEGIGQADKEVLRQLVKEALEEHTLQRNAAVPSRKSAGGDRPRAGASLLSDPLSPYKDPHSAPGFPERSRTAATATAKVGADDESPSRQETTKAQMHDALEHAPVPASQSSATGVHGEDAMARKRVTLEAMPPQDDRNVQIQDLNSQDQANPARASVDKPKEIEIELPTVPATLRMATDRSCTILCGGLKRTNPFRRLCYETFTSARFNAFSLVVTFLNSIYIALAPDLKSGSSGTSNELAGLQTTLFYFDIVCACWMAFEVFLGVISYGCFRSPSTYLRNSGFHKLDAACVIITVSEFFAAMLGLPNITLRPFRMLRFLKPLCKIEMFEGVKNIIQTLREGLLQLMIIFLFLLLTLAGWVILCMSMYANSFSRRCVTRDTAVPICSSDFRTGFNRTCDFVTQQSVSVPVPGGLPAVAAGYPYESWCKILGVEWDKDENGDWVQPSPFNGTYEQQGLLVKRGYYDKGNIRGLEYPKDEFGRYHNCQASAWRKVQNYTTTQRCEVVGNPMGSFSHFDNLWGSVVSLSQVMVPDSYYDVWGRALESEPLTEYPTRFIFITINLLDTFLLLGLFVAVVTGTFKRLREQNERNAAVIEDISESTERSARYTRDGEEEEDISGEEAIQRAADNMSRSVYFKRFISAAIIVQLVAIGGNSEGADQVWRDFGYWSDIVCVSIFILELVLNYLAVGDMEAFWRKLFHRFEIFMVLIALIGIAFGIQELSVLPALRGYRLMKFFPTLEDMLQSAVSSVLAIFNVMVFIIIVGLCYVVAGRYMFGSDMNAISRSNFGSFTMASLTMFQLFTGDSWSGVMYASMQTFPDDMLSQFLGAFLVVSWFIFASIIAQNLFVAVIIENFQIADTIENVKKPGNLHSLRHNFHKAYTHLYKKRNAVQQGHLDLDVRSGNLHAVQDPHVQHIFRNMTNHGGGYRNVSARALYESFTKIEEEIRARAAAVSEMKATASDSRIVRAMQMATSSLLERDYNSTEITEPQRILFFLLPQHPVRRFFVALGESKLFDTVILLAILSSCAFLIIEPPYMDIIRYPEQSSPDTPLVSFDTIALCNMAFTFFFCVEFCCRVMAQGLYFTKGAYLREGWNIIDTVVLMFALVELSGVLEEGGMAKIMRMGRALKPLKLMKRSKSMRVVIDALLATLQPIAYVVLFLIFTLVVFGLIAIGVFGGKLFSCNNPNVVYPGGRRECAGVWTVADGNSNGVAMPSVWDNPYYFNFDSFTSSFKTLFMVSTFKYVTILFACMDISATDLQPVENFSPHWGGFYLVYILVGALFVMNLFVAFIIDGFNAAKGSTKMEEIFSRFRRQLYASRPKYETFKPPKNVVSTQTRKFLEASLFKAFSTACVIVNVCMLLADNAAAREGQYRQIMDLQNEIFFVELCVEVFLCAVAYGLLGFYNDIWRSFDLLVCLGSTVGYLTANRTVTSFVKIFRLARVVRLAARVKAIRAILETLIGTIPQLSNVFLLIYLIYSMFAVAGTQLFATTRFGQRLGPTASYDGYEQAFFLIWQLVTGDEWMILMQDLSVQPPFCTLRFKKEFEPSYQGPGRSWGDCGSDFAWVYFLLLKLVCEYMLLNLFIGLILDNFSYITEDVGHQEDSSWSEGPSEGQLQELCNVFKRYDLGTGFVPVKSLGTILEQLPMPIGYRESDGDLNLKHAYAHELLIRAELNLCMRQRRFNKAEEDRERWFRMFKKPEVKEVFINSVDFETMFTTIVFWRLPSLVPGIVQWQRTERVEEVGLMAHAIQVSEFFRMLVGKRHKKRIDESVRKRRIFMGFCESDPHRKRRNLHTVDMKRRQSEMAKHHGKPLLHLLNHPCDTVHEIILTWLPLDDLPEDLITHSKACQNYHMLRIPQPITGIEVFRQKVSSHDIVFRVIDPNHSKPTGDLLLADFRKVKWQEWHALNTKHETYYAPTVFSGYDEHGKAIQPAHWDRVDLYTRNISKKGQKLKPKRLGSIEDMQSFVVQEESDGNSPSKKKAERAKSSLRFNLGNHQYNSDKVKLQEKDWRSKNKGILSATAASNQLQNLKGLGTNLRASMNKSRSGDSRSRSHVQLSGPVDLSEGDCILEVAGYVPSQPVAQR